MPLQTTARAGVRGSSTVEFALVVPIYFLAVLGSIYGSMICIAYGNMTYASRLGVRYAVVHGSGSTNPCSATDLQNLMRPHLWLVPSPVISINWNPDTDSNSGRVTIVISSTLIGIPLTSANTIPVQVTAAGNILQ